MSNFLTVVRGFPRLVAEAATSAIYDQTVVLAAPITAGTNVTLPLSGTYNGSELEIDLDGQDLNLGTDWNTVGAGTTKTQVAFTFDLLAGDTLRYKKIRGP